MAPQLCVYAWGTVRPTNEQNIHSREIRRSVAPGNLVRTLYYFADEAIPPSIGPRTYGVPRYPALY